MGLAFLEELVMEWYLFSICPRRYREQKKKKDVISK
jgi:hypothetical protein